VPRCHPTHPSRERSAPALFFLVHASAACTPAAVENRVRAQEARTVALSAACMEDDVHEPLLPQSRGSVRTTKTVRATAPRELLHACSAVACELGNFRPVPRVVFLVDARG
jgi:hypothetical protein